MGYYDDHIREERSTRRNKKGSILPAFFGGVIGAIVMLIAMPLMSNFGWISFGLNDGEPPEEIGASPSQPSDLQSVSYSIGLVALSLLLTWELWTFQPNVARPEGDNLAPRETLEGGSSLSSITDVITAEKLVVVQGEE